MSPERKFRVDVFHKDGMHDPAGETIKKGINESLGYPQVTDVRIGKSIEVTIDTESDLEAKKITEALAEDLLINRVLEQYDFVSPTIDAISPLDGRYWERTREIVPYSAESALIRTRTEVESRYLIALSDWGVIRRLSPEERKRLENMGPSLSSAALHKIKKIESRTRHDVKAVEEYMRGVFEGTSLEDLSEMIHFGLTSEDINNLSYRLMLERAKNLIMTPVLEKVVDRLVDMADASHDFPILGRTHGQSAVPTTLGKEIAVFAQRLHKETQVLKHFKLTGKLNGAVGNYNAHALAVPSGNWIAFSEHFVHSLGLEPNLYTTQINPYDDIVSTFHSFQRINGIVLGFDQDMWRYISDDWFAQEVKKDETGSSTMPQKVNPIDFENSEGNIIISNGFFEAMGRKLQISRQQRDLSDSTVVRNVGSALAYSLLSYKSLLTGLGRVNPNNEVMSEALFANWTILTEGVQTVLRLEGVHDSYNLVKALSRGQKIDSDAWQKWVGELPVNDEIKEKLVRLNPANYIGEASRLTKMAIEDIRLSRAT